MQVIFSALPESVALRDAAAAACPGGLYRCRGFPANSNGSGEGLVCVGFELVAGPVSR